MMIYNYFVSYTYRKLFNRFGTGCITLPLKEKIYVNMKSAQQEIERISKCKHVVIIYFRELEEDITWV